jgi:hypothetical protein
VSPASGSDVDISQSHFIKSDGQSVRLDVETHDQIIVLVWSVIV